MTHLFGGKSQIANAALAQFQFLDDYTGLNEPNVINISI